MRYRFHHRIIARIYSLFRVAFLELCILVAVMMIDDIDIDCRVPIIDRVDFLKRRLRGQLLNRHQFLADNRWQLKHGLRTLGLEIRNELFT